MHFSERVSTCPESFLTLSSSSCSVSEVPLAESASSFKVWFCESIWAFSTDITVLFSALSAAISPLSVVLASEISASIFLQISDLALSGAML